MTDPRYEPRTFTHEPGAYGRAGVLSWCAVDERDKAKLVAAKLQHEYALRIRTVACRKYGSLRGYARVAGLNYDRLSKVVRGEVLMRLEDIAMASLWLVRERAAGTESPFVDFFWPEVVTEEEAAHV